jgi:hypothetical protein
MAYILLSVSLRPDIANGKSAADLLSQSGSGLNRKTNARYKRLIGCCDASSAQENENEKICAEQGKKFCNGRMVNVESMLCF